MAISPMITKNETHGTYIKRDSIHALATRNLTTFEVLDYDTFAGNYILIYKEISITHRQESTIERGNTPFDGNVYIQLLYSNGILPDSALYMHNDSEKFTSIGTRTVVYKLHYSIKCPECPDGKPFSVTLATLVVTNDMSEYTLSGERVYGVSLQVCDKYMVYAFELHKNKFTSGTIGGLAYNYDSPRNLEDWNVGGSGGLIWERYKQIVGMINVNDGKGSDVGYIKQKDYDILDPHQYSVGVVRYGR
jgi:hypothetical protein